MSESTAVAQTQAPSLLTTMAARFGVESSKMLATLKATAFKGEVSNEQMMALLIVANEYGLNPWTKEIYAFPDKNNGIVPVLGVDGWTRLMNSNKHFDGIEFDEGGDGNEYWVECIIHRKDRTHPTKVREYLAECKRNTGPWGSHPKRMLRHKALIQCARVAFSYGGVYDEDEAQAIIERDVTDLLPITNKSATARLREVATINQETGDAENKSGVDRQVRESGSIESAAGNDGGSPADTAIGSHNAISSGEVGAGHAAIEKDLSGKASGQAPSIRPAVEIITKIRSIKTLDALDEYISVFDGSKYNEQERAGVQQAYQGRREVLQDAKPAGRKGVD